jgi:5'-nucleotidase
VQEYDARKDPFNRPYFWMSGRFELLDEGSDADIKILNDGFATVTPVQYDLTDYKILREFGDKDF